MVLLEKMFRGLKAEGAKESGYITDRAIDNILKAIDKSFINSKGVLEIYLESISLILKKIYL